MNSSDFYKIIDDVTSIHELYNILFKVQVEETIDIEYEEVKPKQLEENNEKRSN